VAEQHLEGEVPASILARIFLQEDLNFLVTNRIPRRLATQFFGWFSRIESPALTRLSLGVWQLFADDLRLHEAQQRSFRSLHECFVRTLREGARPVDPDPDVLVSPCDAIVGAHGRVEGDTLVQAKGLTYTLGELLGDEALAAKHRDGHFVTLRLKSNMYHRFHAPADARVTRVTYVSGDTWNVNPIALRRVEKLFCKNERAIVEMALPDAREALTLVPVASILVASIRLNVLAQPLDLRHQGRQTHRCDASLAKGQELGYFESGSTIVLFATGPFAFCEGVAEGQTVRVGAPLLRRVKQSSTDETRPR
jgi:phosphatidylserine decarboxylase